MTARTPVALLATLRHVGPASRNSRPRRSEGAARAEQQQGTGCWHRRQKAVSSRLVSQVAYNFSSVVESIGNISPDSDTAPLAADVTADTRCRCHQTLAVPVLDFPPRPLLCGKSRARTGFVCWVLARSTAWPPGLHHQRR